MKIYLDNENKDDRKIVCVKENIIDSAYDVVDLMTNALRAYGYTEQQIGIALVSKCEEWGLIELNDDLIGGSND
jgi:hypothetical protein